MKEDISILQKRLVEVLKDFDDICNANGIRYSLHGGTLLGAERNSRFIPWDDDLDVSMTRENFSLIDDVLNRDNNSKYYIDEKSSWTSRFQAKSDSIYGIDIFIWDYISNARAAQVLKITFLRFLQGTLKEKIEYDRYSGFYRPLLKFTQLVRAVIPKYKLIEAYRTISRDFFTGRKELIHRSNDSFRGITYILDKEYMDMYETIKFEGTHYQVNKRYKEFLEMEYGKDYLIPPPEKDRIPKHTK